jgi:hypothetical protein
VTDYTHTSDVVAFTEAVSASTLTHAYNHTSNIVAFTEAVSVDGRQSTLTPAYNHTSNIVAFTEAVSADIQTIIWGLTETLSLSDTYVAVLSLFNTESINLTDSSSYIYGVGAQIDDVIKLTSQMSVSSSYHQTLVGQALLSDALVNGLTVRLIERLNITEVVSATHALFILDQLKVSSALTVSGVYSVKIAELLALHPSLSAFFGGGIFDVVGLTDNVSRQFIGRPVLADGVTLTDVLGHTLIWRVVENDGIEITDEQLVSAIYHGELSDTIEFSIAYASPSGSFTTWAINTRTGAISEYTNYDFNSFARMGRSFRYMGASKEGLFELDGPDDDGTPIITDIISGFAQFAGSRYTAFKAAYLGIRGEGEFIFKLITGDDKEYIYKAEVKDMKSSRINLGKGLRARYFAFQLTSTGQDFDLESVELLPIGATRRI